MLAASRASRHDKEHAMPEDKPVISYDDFAKLDLRIARVLEASGHPNADRLIVLTVDVGGQPRQIIAGLRQYYEPAAMVGKDIVIVANLAPRKMRGLESQGMLLAASRFEPGAETPADVVVLMPDRPVPSGSTVS
jgi:methionine--tRNA ligase beta chain